MKAFAHVADAIAATPGKLAKVALLGEYLRALDDADLDAAARFFTGNPFAQREERTLSLGGRTIVAAAQAAWGIPDAAIGTGYRETGDLGAALAPHVRPANDLGFFRETLTPSRFKALLDEIASASGKSAAKRRQYLCERAFGACEEPLEAKYVIKILTGELRIGLREGLIVDGIASAFGVPVDEVRRAVMAAGDVGVVARAAKAGTLAEVEIAYGSPIAFMLATPLTFGSDYKDVARGTWLIEDKYDGVRIQAHKHGEVVRLFSRTLNDAARAWPEVVEALRAIVGDCILDGEIVAQREGRVLPFRYLQTRLQRKDVDPALIAEVPVVFVAFDVLARDRAFLLDLPLASRREVLAETISDGEVVRAAPWTALEADSSPESIHERFEEARARGNEGLMLKRTDGAYVPGKRGKGWLKLKRELSTLDVVVVGVEWGHGRRAKVLSDYTFAVRGEGDELLVLGKAYSGLTDIEIADMTAWFLDHRIDTTRAAALYTDLELARGEIVVEPSIVIEIAFDIIQKSELHRSGFALRFPRIVRLRPDKPAAEIDTIGAVRDIYTAMLEREGVTEPSAR